MAKKKSKIRCSWADTHELLAEYHDLEWGVPVHDDRHLFEMLNLEGAQAGLSWLTVLKKREAYQKAFYNFNAQQIVKKTPAEKTKLMKNEGIVRNRLKINAVIENAKAYLQVKKEFKSFDAYLWQFVGAPLGNHQQKKAQIAAEAMSKDLKKRGFRFVGPTICFAFMQGVGMINDHSPHCFKSGRT